MSTYFSELIKAGGQLREFNFRLASINDNSRYIVDVPDDKGGRPVFSIFKNEDGKWQIAGQLTPLWIHDAESALAEAIIASTESELAKKGK